VEGRRLAASTNMLSNISGHLLHAACLASTAGLLAPQQSISFHLRAQRRFPTHPHPCLQPSLCRCLLAPSVLLAGHTSPQTPSYRGGQPPLFLPSLRQVSAGFACFSTCLLLLKLSLRNHAGIWGAQEGGKRKTFSISGRRRVGTDMYAGRTRPLTASAARCVGRRSAERGLLQAFGNAGGWRSTLLISIGVRLGGENMKEQRPAALRAFSPSY